MGMLRGSQRKREVACAARMIALAAFAMAALSATPYAAEINGRIGTGAGSATMDGALIQAYQNNPQLNAQRSATRAADENVSTALAGYRPRVAGTARLTGQNLDSTSRTPALGTTVRNQRGLT